MKFSNSAAAIGAAASVFWPRYHDASAFVTQQAPSLPPFPSGPTVTYAKKGGGFGGGSAGGGFGGGGGTSAPSKKKSAKKRKRGDMESLLVSSKKETEESKSNADEPQLDRFGLPIPTEDDVFPPLPADTELIAVQEDEPITMADIRTAMKDHVQLNFDLFDDATCLEKNPANGATPMKLRLLHRSPPVLAIDNFFSDGECDEYIALSSEDETHDGGGALKVDSKTFSLSLATRTSTTWFLHYRQVPTLLAKTSRLLADLPIERIEEPQLVRYKTGEQFSYHYDALPGEELDRNGGQRVATLLVYLRTIDDDKGGATEFRDLRDSSGNTLSMRPTKGSVLLFFPAFGDGQADDRTLHKGEVAVDEKMIGQIWVHQGKYNPAVPEGNSHLLAQDAVTEKRKELGYETIA